MIMDMMAAEIFENIEIAKDVKSFNEHNPVMTQRFGADPYALVYDGRVYLYMTGDAPTYDKNGEIEENTYGNINTINVISSDDLVNWTDHGTIYAAGDKGAAKWGANSWAPAAAYKNIDGKDKFFLYFANNGNGIAVLTADSPVGPFTDPLDAPLISRNTPTCAEVTWLFDPAVLMDDDGNSYIYFGGGVPSPDKAANPGTARVAKLSDDMISLDGDPKVIADVDYLFEDSGINRVGDSYYYSYCSNFSMTPEAEKELGFSEGEIVTMVSKDPMGPFEMYKPVLKNPGYFFGLGGNNHHCMFEFKGQWYIAYHTRILEEAMGITSGYRSTSIDQLNLDENGGPCKSEATRQGVKQVKPLNPYNEVMAVTMANSSGVTTRQNGPDAVRYGSGEMILTGIQDGSWTCVEGAQFEYGKPLGLEVNVRGRGNGAIKVSLDSVDGETIAYIPVKAPGRDFTTIEVPVECEFSGKHDVYFTFMGDNYELLSWRFLK